MISADCVCVFYDPLRIQSSGDEKKTEKFVTTQHMPNERIKNSHTA